MKLVVYHSAQPLAIVYRRPQFWAFDHQTEPFAEDYNGTFLSPFSPPFVIQANHTLGIGTRITDKRPCIQ
jgi:hypothetical protein